MNHEGRAVVEDHLGRYRGLGEARWAEPPRYTLESYCLGFWGLGFWGLGFRVISQRVVRPGV